MYFKIILCIRLNFSYESNHYKTKLDLFHALCSICMDSSYLYFYPLKYASVNTHREFTENDCILYLS